MTDMTRDELCWKGRFSREGETAWPPCPNVARWRSRGIITMQWCDLHRHADDVLLVEELRG